jgi:hypothetical protein
MNENYTYGDLIVTMDLQAMPSWRNVFLPVVAIVHYTNYAN